MAGKMMVRILSINYLSQCSICQNIYSKNYNFCYKYIIFDIKFFFILLVHTCTFIVLLLEKTSRSAAGSSKASERDGGKLSSSMNKASFYFLCLFSLFSLFYHKKSNCFCQKRVKERENVRQKKETVNKELMVSVNN